MARVEEKHDLLTRAAQRYSKWQYGREITITPVIAQSRPNMIGWGAFEWLHERSHRVDEKLKILAATKAATMVGCEFCIDIGSALGRGAGVTDEQLRDFHNYRESAAFSVVEKLVIEYAEEMTKANVEVSDELFARLREHFDDRQIVELTAAIALENFRARFNIALEIPPSGFSEGKFCPLPDRQSASTAA